MTAATTTPGCKPSKILQPIDAAIEAFAPGWREDAETAAADLLVDLHHWCDRQGLDFDVLHARAAGYYVEETDNG